MQREVTMIREKFSLRSSTENTLKQHCIMHIWKNPKQHPSRKKSMKLQWTGRNNIAVFHWKLHPGVKIALNAQRIMFRTTLRYNTLSSLFMNPNLCSSHSPQCISHHSGGAHSPEFMLHAIVDIRLQKEPPEVSAQSEVYKATTGLATDQNHWRTQIGQ